MTDTELLEAARAVTGLPWSRFAPEVLGVDVRTVTRWRDGDRRTDPTARIVCWALVTDPALLPALTSAALAIRAQDAA